MVRFQPPSAASAAAASADEDEASPSTSSSSDEERERDVQRRDRDRDRKQEPQKRADTRGRRSLTVDESEMDEDEDDEEGAVALPLKGRTPAPKQKQRRHHHDEYDEEEEEEEKYPTTSTATRGTPSRISQSPYTASKWSGARTLTLGAEMMMAGDEEEEEEEELADEGLEEEEEEDEAALEEEEEAERLLAQRAAASRSIFPTRSPSRRASRPPKQSPLSNFLARLSTHIRPIRAKEYRSDNIFAPSPAAQPVPATAVPPSHPSQQQHHRSILEFNRHSFRPCFSSMGHVLFFPSDQAGFGLTRMEIDPCAVDTSVVKADEAVPTSALHFAAADESIAQRNREEKKTFIRCMLDTHLRFHSASNPANAPDRLPEGRLASSAKLFGSKGPLAMSTTATGGFGFGSSSGSGMNTPQHVTPFTRLCDAYIDALKQLLATRSSPFSTALSSSPSSSSSSSASSSSYDLASEIELALSTFTLLRCLYSKEEAEARAPKLSKDMDAIVSTQLSTTSSSTLMGGGRGMHVSVDASIETARKDEYALWVGREAAFEQGWLQPTISANYVTPRIRHLQQQSSDEAMRRREGDGVSGNKMQEVLTHLIGHDLLSATKVALNAGNFRLATLLAQLDSFAYTAADSEGQVDDDHGLMSPSMQTMQRDIQRQLSLWLSKDRGVGDFISHDLIRIYRLMSGDVLVEPSLDWVASLGVHYWYTQPKSVHTQIRQALLNYKKEAWKSGRAAMSKVRRPFPPYPSYVPVEQRHGGNASAAAAVGAGMRDEDIDEDGDNAVGGSSRSQALILANPSTLSRPTHVEYTDIRYGLLDIWSDQSHQLARVLSPQSHVPHVLDHQLAWHLFTTMQSTPMSSMGPNVNSLYMNYIHQLELLSVNDDEQDSSSPFGTSIASSHDDMWKWSVYIALASPLPHGSDAALSDAFDRESIVKHILMSHVDYSMDRPFELAGDSSNGTNNALSSSLLGGTFQPPSQLFSSSPTSANVASSAPSLPTSLPILRVDDANFFHVAVEQEERYRESFSNQQATTTFKWGESSSLPSASSPLDPTTDFLLKQCHIPPSWLYECKAIRAELHHHYSIACFYHLHGGDIAQAYRIWWQQLMAPWMLAILNKQQATQRSSSSGSEGQHASNSSSTDEAAAAATLFNSLLSLLQYFHFRAQHVALHGWSSGGSVVLHYLELVHSFETNLHHFTQRPSVDQATGSTVAASDRIERLANFRTYKKELHECLEELDVAGREVQSQEASLLSSVDAAQCHMKQLVIRKMSGNILTRIHALQPLEEEINSEERLMRQARGERVEQASMEEAKQGSLAIVAAGEFVSAADRLAIINDAKDAWLQSVLRQTA